MDYLTLTLPLNRQNEKGENSQTHSFTNERMHEQHHTERILSAFGLDNIHYTGRLNQKRLIADILASARKIV